MLYSTALFSFNLAYPLPFEV